MITVFTPAFNRAHTLKKLFDSLEAQSSKNFEWIIVDDGSTDNTEDLIKDLNKNASFKLKYFKQSNGGKHRAINKGVKEAQGNLFFIVDSDDYLAQNAIEFLNQEWSKIKDNDDFVGISGIRVRPSLIKIGDELPFKHIDCSVIDFRFKNGYKGDMAEAWRTKTLSENPFPEIEGEKFITEAVIWNRISKHKKVRFFNEPIYICEYLDGGLTSNMTRLRMKNPVGCMVYYSEESMLSIPLKNKLKSYINFWRFAFNSKYPFSKKISIGGPLSLIGFIPGYLMFQHDKKAFKNE